MNRSTTCTLPLEAEEPSCVLRGESGSVSEYPIHNFVRPSTAVRYFWVDLDGTFVSHNAECMKRNIETFLKTIARGHQIFFCTGRTLQGALSALPVDVRESIGFHGYPGVYQNGAIVYGPDGRLLREAHFSSEVLSRIIDGILYAKHEKYCIFLSKDSWHVITDDLSSIYSLLEILEITTEVEVSDVEGVKSSIITKIIIMDYDKISGNFHNMRGVDFIIKGGLDDIVDVSPIGVTKASGLEVLLSELGVSPSECGFIGDGENDVEAMHFIGHSFAVGNAIDKAKAAAKYIVQQTNDECAFTTVMEAVYGIS